MELNLTKAIDRVIYPETYVVYVEKHGPFKKSAEQAWHELSKFRDDFKRDGFNSRTGRTRVGLSFVDRTTKDVNEALVYEAGVEVEREPHDLPDGLKYRKIGDEPYARFVLTGPYSNVPAAFSSVYKRLSENHVQLRHGLCIERYLSDEKTTPDEELQTEILIPIA